MNSEVAKSNIPALLSTTLIELKNEVKTMSSTENSYSETDLGNVSPNPRGEYDPETSYEYLDLVNYEGGSYLCLAELGTTVTGVAPAHGKNTETWQLLTLP